MNLKNIIDFVVKYAMILTGFISVQLSIKNRNKFGKIVGNIMRLLSKNRSNVTLDNIKNALPELDFNQQIEIRDAAYHNLGITLVELLAFPTLSDDDICKYLKIENYEKVIEKAALGKGIIFLSAHYGNWELTAFVAGKFFDFPINLVVKEQSNKFVDKYLNQFRTRSGNKVIKTDKTAAKKIIQSLRNNEALTMLVDQSADFNNDIFVDFFGRPAATFESPAVLALKYRSPIFMAYTDRLDDCTYKLVLEELDYTDLDDSKNSIYELTKRHVNILENKIRKNPGLWSWQHKRWKHTPPVNL